MNKRLRKKKRMGEFQELGFYVEWKVPLEEADSSSDEFVDFTESLYLCCGGGYTCPVETKENELVKLSYFVSKYKNSVTEKERKKYIDFLSKINTIEYHVGKLQDAWYD